MRLGFACEWSRPPEKTWSHIPSSLLSALGRVSDVDMVNISGQLPAIVLNALKILSLRYQPKLQRFSTQVMFSKVHNALVEKRMMAEIAGQKPDAVISIFDYLADPGIPQYIYYDLCVAELQSVLSDPFRGRYERVQYSSRMIQSRRKYQQEVYQNVSGLFAMSEYAARTSCEYYGIERSKVHVVHAGCNVQTHDASARPLEREYVLFVGRDFQRKGGDLVVDAMNMVRKHHNVDLVIAGPEKWMRKESMPDGIHMLGNISPTKLHPFYQHASLFVMPSYFEAFGIAFAEALCYGIPVIARNSCAMPEIVTHGSNGFLLGAQSESPAELADLIITALSSTQLRHQTKEQAAKAREYYSWNRVARDMVQIIHRDLNDKS